MFGPLTALAVRWVYLRCGLSTFKSLVGAAPATETSNWDQVTPTPPPAALTSQGSVPSSDPKADDAEEPAMWGTFWLAAMLLEAIFTLFSVPLFFVPFSPEIRLAAIVWLTPGPCQFGCCGGAALIHARLVVPFLKKTDGKIDSRSALAFLAESSKQAVADAAVAARRFAAPMVATANEVVEDLTEQAKELREGLIESPAAAAAETPDKRTSSENASPAPVSMLSKIVAAATEHEKARQSSAAHETAAANKADEVVAFAAGAAAGVTATIAADSGHPETPPEDPATPPLDD
eukprot:PRCOL_00004067-RA